MFSGFEDFTRCWTQASSHTICCNYSTLLGLLLASPQSDGHSCRTGRTAENFHFVMVSVLGKDQMIC